MALNVNCDGFQRERYFSRSWALITQDEGWIKPVLLLTLALFIPILGPLGVSGYTVEWARLVAWNVNAAPKQRGVNIGECIVSGWRTFLVSLGWGLLASLAFMVLAFVPLLGPLLMIAAAVFCIYLTQLLRVACLRASIYQQLSAGYKGGRIWEMGERDVDGLMHIVGIDVISNLIVGTVFSAIAMIVFAAMMPSFISMITSLDAMYYVETADEVLAVLQGVFDLLIAFAPAYIIIGLVASFCTTLINLILMGAIGLWMRQFNVPAWGRSDDPLPQPLPETVVYYQNAPAEPAQTYGYGYAAQQGAYDQGYAYTPQQNYDQTFNQAYEQAYNQAYEQAYGHAPQEAAPAPEAAYVPEAAFVPEAQVVAETMPVAEAAPAPEAAPEVAPAPEAAPESAPAPEPAPETPADSE